jgi:ribonuclease BN (tRNA processing enzyme)
MSQERLTLRFLGCGDAFSSGGYFQTSFLLQSGEFSFLVDCGATTLTALKKYRVSPDDIDAILITHFHGDHYGGLPYVLLDGQYIQKREKPLTIAGPRGLRSKVLQLMDLLYPGNSPLEFDYEILFIEYESRKPFMVGPLHVEAFPVPHSEEALSHALRVQTDSKTLAFSGDTGWTDDLYELEKEADLFICECNMYELEMKSHLNYKTLMEKKSNFTSKRLIINHLGETMLSKLNELELEAAEEGKVITVP